MSEPLEPDRGQIEQFVNAVFRHCGNEGFISLRSFFDDNKPFRFEAVTAGDFEYLCTVAEDLARRCANEPKKIVFCPPIATFSSAKHAREQDLLLGLALSVECDKDSHKAREKLEKLLGPATVVVYSGGQDRLHIHFRLRVPARGNDLVKLKRARDLAARLVGADPSNKSVVHPLRWPGSWHRKGDPVLCKIATLEPDREIDLTSALAALEAAALPRAEDNGAGHDGQQQQYNNDGAPPDWAALTANIIAGKDLHESTMRLAASYIGTGIKPDHAVRHLHALMLASATPHDERWKSRFDDLARLVRDAHAKFGAENPGSPQPDEADVGNYVCLGDVPAKPPEELIKGLVPKEGVAVTGGQASAGKTFIKIHKSVCLATGTAYFGHRIIERVGTVFVAAEGRPLLPNRFAATLAKLSIAEKLPIMWPKRLPDFSCADGIKRFVLELKEIDRRYRGDFGVRLGHVPIDTVAANFAMKDEDDNAEASKICNVLRSIGDEIGTLMAPVHHYGKNAESGLRGASAWKGSADMIEGVLADIAPLSGRVSNRELVCAKARDGEQGPIAPFDLEFIELGLNDDGEIYGSCCVAPGDGPSRVDNDVRRSKGQRAIQDAIVEVLDGQGRIITPRSGMPPVKAALVADVRLEFDKRYVVDEINHTKAAHAKRMAFKRALDQLSPTHFGAGSCEGRDWIWRIT